MFFVKSLERELLLHPTHFGPALKDTLRLKLIEDIEGKSLGKHGFVIGIMEVRDEDIGMGFIQDATGLALFNVKFKAVLCRPFKNEVMDAVVTAVNEHGFFCEVGPLQVFVHRYRMPEDMLKGYDMEQGAWMSDDKEVEIKKGSGVRVRVEGIVIDAAEIHMTATIKGDFLGLISAAV
eukprot:PLAT6939.1.p2 GENE.PLAT6939.1~~PLAT6939.1.p2  ORF type:complete len:178 (+),score=64.95 PLAT6939.1:3-536(+)